MSISGFTELYHHADALRNPIGVVAAGGADPTVLQSLRQACDRGWVRPIVAGTRREIGQAADGCGIALDGIEVLDTDDPAGAAVQAIRDGRAQLLMKGQVSTPALMRATLAHDTGLRTGRTMCQVVLVELLQDGRRLLLADTGICPQPTLDQKAEILQAAVEIAHALGEPLPRVALVAASDTITDAMPETLDAAELAGRNQIGQLPGCVVQGPLSFDLAYDHEAAAKKQVEGPVVGAADIIVFPNLVSANLTVKAIMYTAQCRFGGVLCGATCPVVFMSRADTTATRLNSLALALKVIRGRCDG
jgi:phosphotransacetylase